MVLFLGCESLFLENFQKFIINGGEGAWDEDFKLWQSLFLIKLHAATSSRGVYNGVCS